MVAPTKHLAGQAPAATGATQDVPGKSASVGVRGRRQQESFRQLIRRPHLPLFENCQKEVGIFSKEKSTMEHILRFFCYIFWPPFAPGVPPICTTSNKARIKNKDVSSRSS